MVERRVRFDFEIDFTNGGGIQGQDFRLDIDDAGISDEFLSEYIVRDLRLLMVGEVRILNKEIINEPHKRNSLSLPVARGSRGNYIDLSHTIVSGMTTYRGLPAPIICDHISFVESHAIYAQGTEFQIGKIEMVANTGTYIDSPYHRFPDGADISALGLEKLSGLPGIVVRVTGMDGRSIDRPIFTPVPVEGRAVLVQTDWDRHWGTDRYFDGHPYLTESAATYLRDRGALLVGIDSLNIDDTAGRTRPVHTTLLGAGIPIVEHLTGLSALPIDGFEFFAVPPKIERMGTFPVRAHAVIGATA